MYLKEKEIEAMKLLAKYKFLTSSQFVKLDLYKNRGDVSNCLKAIIDKKKPLYGMIKFPTDPKKGKLEYIYYLTKYGQKALIEDLEYAPNKIKSIVKSIPTSTKDYFHRKYTIDFHISLSQYLDNISGEIVFLNYYFDKGGSNRSKSDKPKGVNRLCLENGKSFIPDIITKFKANKHEYLFLFEQHNGNDTKRLIEQLYIHLLSISEGTASKMYNFPRINRVAVVCEFESVKNAVIERLQKTDDFKEFYNFFIFKTNDEVKQDFFNNWTLIDNQKVSFIQKRQEVL